jgi:prophage antirepressor-like protein
MDYDFTKIRRKFDNGQWYFAYMDVIAALTGSKSPRRYATELKNKLQAEGSEVFGHIEQLKIVAPDGKLRSTQCLSREDTFRLIEEIPSPKAEPFKQWIAHLAHERLEEIKNPSKGIDNSIKRWKEMGKSDEWIAWRLKGKISRKSETDTLQAHGITKPVDFAHFTDRTNKAVYGATAEEVKEDRGLAKTDSLRDNSSALELRFLDLHELGCSVGIEQRKAYGRTQINGVYDVVDGIVENTKQAFIDAFGVKAVTSLIGKD